MYYKCRYKFDDITYKIALYIRLSREDGDDLESESIYQDLEEIILIQVII